MKRTNIKYVLTCLIITLSLFLGASCVPSIEPTPSPAPAPAPTPTTTPINPDWTPPTLETKTPLLPNLAEVVAKVKPSVVAINTEVITYDIFNRPFTQEGAGSGWIIDEDGIIVTNNHVVEGAKSVTVTLADGRTFPAETIRTDPLTDLAVVKVKAQNLPAVDVGDSSQLRVGDWVIAIGNPLGLGISAKEGIVSRKGVSVPVSPGQTLYDLIETSAAINPGNSGGPLVNMAAEVIGITSAKIATVGVEGMGYAISSQAAVPIIEELIISGYVVHPWLGVGLHDIEQWLAVRYNLAVDKGAFVTHVAPDSPADKAGIEPGDVITGFGAKEINNAEELIKAIRSSQIGQRIEITLWRGNTERTTSAILTERPPS